MRWRAINDSPSKHFSKGKSEKPNSLLQQSQQVALLDKQANSLNFARTVAKVGRWPSRERDRKEAESDEDEDRESESGGARNALQHPWDCVRDLARIHLRYQFIVSARRDFSLSWRTSTYKFPDVEKKSGERDSCNERKRIHARGSLPLCSACTRRKYQHNLRVLRLRPLYAAFRIWPGKSCGAFVLAEWIAEMRFHRAKLNLGEFQATRETIITAAGLSIG